MKDEIKDIKEFFQALWLMIKARIWKTHKHSSNTDRDSVSDDNF